MTVFLVLVLLAVCSALAFLVGVIIGGGAVRAAQLHADDVDRAVDRVGKFGPVPEDPMGPWLIKWREDMRAQGWTTDGTAS